MGGLGGRGMVVVDGLEWTGMDLRVALAFGGARGVLCYGYDQDDGPWYSLDCI